MTKECQSTNALIPMVNRVREIILSVGLGYSLGIMV
jgi:hypothetical protein